MSAASAPLTVQPGAQPGCLIASGALDFETAAAADAQSAAWLTADVREIDLAGLSSSDSAALALLVVWAARMQRHGVTLAYRQVPAGLRALAVACGADQVLDLGH